MWGQIEPNIGKCGTTQNSSSFEGDLLDTAITRNHKNGYYGFTIEDGHLQQQPNTIKFG